MIAEREGVVLRRARDDDLPAIDRLTTLGYAAIQASFVAMLGEDCYEVVQVDPQQTWSERKLAQNRELFDRHPEQVWILDHGTHVFGFVTFWIFPERSYGHLDNNAVDPARTGEGWSTFMYRHVLNHFRRLGLRYAHVDTGLDDAHAPARRAYEAVGFDRSVPSIDLWLRL